MNALLSDTGAASPNPADAFATKRLSLLKQAGVDTSTVKTSADESAAVQWRQVSEALMPELHQQAQAAGYSHVLDFLKAGAKADGKLPAAGSRTAGAYTSPTEQVRAERAKLEASGLDAKAATAKIHTQALAYANGQLAHYQKVADKTGDSELKKILTDKDLDPIARYTQASKRVSILADKAGYADPRVYVRTLLSGTAGSNS